MSWSLTLIGNPDKIVSALEKQSETLTGQSKTEFDAALPHMIGLVKQNHNKTQEPVLKITANGHGYDGYNNCSVNIEPLSGILV